MPYKRVLFVAHREEILRQAAEQHKLFEAAGLETVRQEIIDQMQDFFDEK